MNELRIVHMINRFPIGDIPANRAEMLSKAEIVSYLARFQKQFSSIENVDEREQVVRTFLSEVLALTAGEQMPSLAQAESTLKLSSGFIQDYGKVQYIKENNLDFDKTYDTLAQYIELSKEAQRKTL